MNAPRSRNESKTPKIHQRNSALRLIRCGELSRAATILRSKGSAPATQPTVDKLASKHPIQRQVPEYEDPKSDSGLNLNQQSLARMIRSPPRGCGGGPSGWRHEHLRAMIADHQSVTIFTFYAVLLHLPHFLKKPSLFCQLLVWLHYQKDSMMCAQ